MANHNTPDIYRVELYFTDPETLRRISGEFHPEFATRRAKKDEHKEEWIVEVYITQAQIDFLKNNNIKYTIIENASEKGRERQKEVGKGNRFEKESNVPKGLGKKTK
jgi:hypothetical protein